MFHRRVHRLLIAGACSLLLACTTMAQVITGTIIGTIRDGSGGILPGATVTIESPALPGGPQTFVTNERGQYRFTALPPGNYTLVIALSGFANYREEGIRVSVGGTVERNVAMNLSSVTETITVTGESPIVDTKKSGVSANFGNEYMEQVPVRRFSMFDFLKWSPGVSATSPSSGSTMSMSAFGSATNDNQFLMDGTDFTAPVSGNAWPYPDTDVIEEVEVVSLGASAEYGNMQGAVFNVVTKQGTNEFNFDVSLFAQPDWATSKPIKEDCDCPEGETGFTRGRYRDYTFHAGGPIFKDKAWFYGGAQYQRDYDNQPGTDPSFPRKWEADRIYWKVTWQITEDLKFMHTYHDDYWVIPATPSLSDPFETISTYGGHNPSVTFGNITHVLSPNTFYDVRAAGFYSPDDYCDPNGGYTNPWRYDSATGISSGGSFGFCSFSQGLTNINAKLSHYATDFIGADHDFKFGVQWANGTSRGVYGYPGGVHYYDYYGEPYYAYFREPYSYGGAFRRTGVFAEDLLRFGDRLTLQLGVRFDHSNARSQNLPAVDAEGNEIGGTINGLGELFTWDIVSPRVGFNLKLTEDGRTLLRGNYGRFYQTMITSDLSLVHPGRTPYSLVYFDPATGGYTDVVSVTDPIANLRVDPDTGAPKTDQFSIGLDRELTRDLAVGVTYIHKEGDNYTGFQDVTGVYGESTVTLDNGQTIPVFPLLSDPDARVYEYTNPRGRYARFTKYDGLLLTFQKRFSNRWQAFVSYTYSKAEGLVNSNGLGPASSQNTNAGGFSTSRFGRDPNDITNATGRLLNDRPHMFRVQSSYELPAGILLGANFQYLTGKPFAPQANVRLPQGTRQIYLEPLGSERLESQVLMDFRVSKVFRFSEERRVEVLIDILNALQEKAPENIVTRNFFSSNYARGNRFIDPLRAMFGVKFHF